MVDDADRMVARAIESVLDQVPGTVDTSLPDVTSAKLQPWAETAAPVGRNKRPLEELLVELEQSVAADPQARATLPRTRHPALAFFDRFGRTAGQPAGGAPTSEGGSRRRRRRRGGGGGGQAGTPMQATTAPAASPPDRPQGGRRRSRRGRGGGGGASERAPGPIPGAASGQDNATAGGQPRGPGSGGRRRRGRRGRGGDRQSAG
jgi:hypothetical protein